MKPSPKTLQIESLLLMKQEIFLDWLNKFSFFEIQAPFMTFSQINDPKIFCHLINRLIFEDFPYQDANLDFLLEKWKNYQEIPYPLFLEHINSIDIIKNPDTKLLLLEFLYNISFRNSKISNKLKKISKEKSRENSIEISYRSREENLRKSLEKNAKPKENLEISPIRKSLPYRSIPKEIPSISDKIPEISTIFKRKLLNWLISIGLLRKDVEELEEKLPKICNNGVIYADLIERLHGKSCFLKGIIRKPKNNSQILANFSKVFCYFRGFEKLNPRFLFNEKELSDSNHNIFWNFLDDLFYFFNNKASPNDSRYLQLAKKQKNLPKTPQEPENSYISQEKYKEKPKIINKKTEEPFEFEKNSQFIAEFSIKTPPKRNSYHSIYQEKQSLLHQELYKGSKSRALSFYSSVFTPEKQRRNSFDSQHQNRSLIKKSPIKTKAFISEETKNSIKNWLKELGFRGYFLEKDEKNLLLDPFRNGLLLYTILGALGYQPVRNPLRKPQNIQEIRENWRISWETLKKNGLENVFSVYFADIDEFIKGDSSGIFSVLNQLRNAKIYGSIDIEKSMTYSQEEVKSLEKTLLVFLKDLSISEEINLEGLYKGVKTGVLLCEIVKKTLKSQKELFCFKNPKNQGEMLMNINKALEMLRKVGKIGEKFLWKSKEILFGDKETILGLLEDIVRFYLELHAREGANYFADGPISEILLEKRRISKKIKEKSFFDSNNKENRGKNASISGSMNFSGKNEKMYSFLTLKTEKIGVLGDYNK